MDQKDLFANDGSFMERFMQMQKEMEQKSKSPAQTSNQNLVPNKRPLDLKPSDNSKKNKETAGGNSNGKLAFSLKSKSKVVAPAVKLGIDEEEEEEELTGGSSLEPAKRHKSDFTERGYVATGKEEVVVRSPPGDYTVRKVIDRLAVLVAKNGRQHEHITRQRNPGDTPFKFLFDKNCAEYKYYEYRLSEEEKALAQSKESSHNSGSHRSTSHEKSKYQTPASALYDDSASSGGGPASPDPVAMMEYYMKKAAQEEKKKPYKLDKSEMPPPPSLLGGSSGSSGSSSSGYGKRGHHMGDFIPQEELEKFMSQCNDAAARKATQEAAEKAKIQADNIGHKLLSKMGWKEGSGLGSGGRVDPVMAGDVKKDNLGVGAEQPGEVKPEDDIYEQYKKRMMLGYKHRPNPLGNPRKAYY